MGTVLVYSEFGDSWPLSYSVFNKTAVQRCLVAYLSCLLLFAGYYIMFERQSL
jgi:hypothetical protein